MHYINGQWLAGEGAAFTSEDPATGTILWQGKAASPAQVHQAVDAARAAFPAWAATPYEERLAILTRFRDLLREKQQELATYISEETGKMLWDAGNEAAAMVAKLDVTVTAYLERTPQRHSVSEQGAISQLQHRPHGVMAVYGPYNFPAHLPNGHIMPALLAGNTLVFKPSEQTPRVAEWMLHLWEQSGLPAGVLNLVQGEADTGIALAAAPIDGLLFTGSSRTGLLLHQQFAGRPEVLLALEMGGNNAMILHDAPSVDAAVVEIIQAAYMSTGQRCTCARRLVVVDTPANRAIVERLAEVAERLQIGQFRDVPSPFMGPLISMREAGRLLDAQASLLAAGGISLLEMRQLVPDRPFISAGLIDVTPIKDKTDDEWFGPLLQVMYVPGLDAAITTANATRFGLSASIFSADPAIWQRCLRELRAGVININRQSTGAAASNPFGGVGCSGNHRPAAYYAADYCAYPVASLGAEQLSLPSTLPAGLLL